MTSGQQPENLVIVDAYRLAYNAGRALTLDEFIDGLPSAYQNDANRWWVGEQEAAGADIPAEPWSIRHLRYVRSQWFNHLLTRNVSSRKRTFIAVTEDGSPARGKPRKQLRYMANKEKPPLVRVQVETWKTVPWTPEIGATGRRHVAGIKFRDAMADIEAKGRLEVKGGRNESKATKQDLEKALELAAEALRYAAPTG